MSEVPHPVRHEGSPPPKRHRFIAGRIGRGKTLPAAAVLSGGTEPQANPVTGEKRGASPDKPTRPPTGPASEPPPGPGRRCRYCDTVNCTKTMCIAMAGHDRRHRGVRPDPAVEVELCGDGEQLPGESFEDFENRVKTAYWKRELSEPADPDRDLPSARIVLPPDPVTDVEFDDESRPFGNGILSSFEAKLPTPPDRIGDTVVASTLLEMADTMLEMCANLRKLAATMTDSDEAA